LQLIFEAALLWHFLFCLKGIIKLMIDILNYGFTPAMLPVNIDTEGTPARIMAAHKDRYELVCDHGACFGRLKTSVYFGGGLEEFPTVGDFVLINYNNSGDSQITKTLERKSKFARNDFSGHAANYVKTVLEQVIAVNFDYVFIMQSLNHDLNIKRLERYLTLSWQSGAVPAVILTKTDIAGDYAEKMREVEKTASGAGVFAVSAKTGFGLDSLAEYLKPRKTIVFLGSSGVGKSSLVNALAGEEVMAVKEIREDDSKGRHTTTHRQLIMLESGVMIIDTPGMRELGMWDSSEGLSMMFSDVEEYFNKCRFSDCKHNSEPDCAVKSALESGELPRERWESYLQIKRETRFVDDRSGYLKSQKELHKKWEKESRVKNNRKKSGRKKR